MAFSSPATVVTGDTITAAWANTDVRDNMNATMVAKCTAAGDIAYATGANALARLAKGAAADALVMNSGATAPEWSAASYLLRHTATAKVRIASVSAAFNSGGGCNKDTLYSYTWTYGVTFSAAPVVLFSVLSSADTDPVQVGQKIYNITTTTARLDAYFSSGGSPTPVLTAQAIAIGAIS